MFEVISRFYGYLLAEFKWFYLLDQNEIGGTGSKEFTSYR